MISVQLWTDSLVAGTMLHFIVPQTGLALMGLSRYCLSSLDLLHFVVREHRGAVAEPPRSRRGECSGYLWLTAWTSGSLGNPGICKSGNSSISFRILCFVLSDAA